MLYIAGGGTHIEGGGGIEAHIFSKFVIDCQRKMATILHYITELLLYIQIKPLMLTGLNVAKDCLGVVWMESLTMHFLVMKWCFTKGN